MSGVRVSHRPPFQALTSKEMALAVQAVAADVAGQLPAISDRWRRAARLVQRARVMEALSKWFSRRQFINLPAHRAASLRRHGNSVTTRTIHPRPFYS